MKGFGGIGRGKIKQLVLDNAERRSQSNSDCKQSKSTTVQSSGKYKEFESPVEYAKKPQPGTHGKKIALVTNSIRFRFQLEEKMKIYHYDVTIECSDSRDIDEGAVAFPSENRRIRKMEKYSQRLIIDRMFEEYGGDCGLFDGILPVYDGDKTLYINQELDENSEHAVKSGNQKVRFILKVEISEPEDMESLFIVRLKKVGTMEIDPNATIFSQNALRFIDIAMKYCASRDKITIANKIFPPSDSRRFDLKQHKELAFGFSQSTRNSDCGLLLNVDRAAAVFHKGGKMLHVFSSCIRGFQPSISITERQRVQMTNELKGLKFKVTHLAFPMKMKVLAISEKSAKQTFFMEQEKDINGRVISETEVSVADYFSRVYDDLKYPNLPCVMTGSKAKPRYFPLEGCEVIGDQYIPKNFSSEVVTEMTKRSTSQSPNQRFEEIEKQVNQAVRNLGNEYLYEFKIQLDTNLLQVEGRVLLPPLLNRGSSQGPVSFRPDEKTGEWSMTRPNRQFLNPVAIDHWVLAELKVPHASSVVGEIFMKQFSVGLINAAAKNGITMAAAVKMIAFEFSVETLRAFMQSALKHVPKLQLFVFMIPRDDKMYSTVKLLGDKEFGVATQCISLAHHTDPRGNKLETAAYQSNVILKINSKLGGLKTVLEVGWKNDKRIMFVGIDVTHPSPGDGISVSIASCVASYDYDYCCYSSIQRVQKQTNNDIVELDVMMNTLFEKFKNFNSLFPDCVIVYRDGISANQFDNVSNIEIQKILKLMEKKGIKAELTYLVVQKRHNIRFIPKIRSEGIENGNVPAGTVVDKSITTSDFYDFYLCSHSCRMGTSRPAHYYVLYDKNNIPQDVMQRITYDLTYTLPRCNKPLSVVVPVYYAHLSAYRARHFLASAEQSYASSASGSEDNRMSQDYIDSMNDAIRVNSKFTDKLYYI